MSGANDNKVKFLFRQNDVLNQIFHNDRKIVCVDIVNDTFDDLSKFDLFFDCSALAASA